MQEEEAGVWLSMVECSRRCTNPCLGVPNGLEQHAGCGACVEDSCVAGDQTVAAVAWESVHAEWHGIACWLAGWVRSGGSG